MSPRYERTMKFEPRRGGRTVGNSFCRPLRGFIRILFAFLGLTPQATTCRRSAANTYLSREIR